MARSTPGDRAKRRAAVSEKMDKSPVQRIAEAGIRAYEDIRGLNIGGAESGRRAKAKAKAKAANYQPTMMGRAAASGQTTQKGLTPGAAPTQDEMEDMISGKKAGR